MSEANFIHNIDVANFIAVGMAEYLQINQPKEWQIATLERLIDYAIPYHYKTIAFGTDNNAAITNANKLLQRLKHEK